MNDKNKKIILIIIISLISLLAIFCLSKIVIAPNAIIFPAISLPELFYSAPKSEIIHNQNLPIIETAPVTIMFGGDVMLSRQVNAQMTKNEDYSWPFVKIADFLSAADLTIINLESPFIIAENYSVPTGSFSFQADPQAIIGLTKSGIDLVTLANNHILNQGAQGLEETKNILTAEQIKSIGAGQNSEIAWRPEIFTIKDQKFAFLAYAYPNDNSVATTDQPGIANMDIEKMITDVKKLKQENDTVIVTMHAGEEYTTKPNEQQITFAHQAIEAGADLVIGHHPHWPQIWEIYQDKPIIYSLGNLVFDQMWSKETSQGLLAKLTWQGGWQEIEFIPINIRNYGQAEVMSNESEKAILFKKLNIPINGKINLAKPNLKSGPQLESQP